LIWPRISPPGQRVVWMFAYALPVCIAFRISANDPASMPWSFGAVPGPITSAGPTSPSTVPEPFGHGVGFVLPPQRKNETPPATERWPKCTCAKREVPPSSPE
jgi:hypothetical protein